MTKYQSIEYIQGAKDKLPVCSECGEYLKPSYRNNGGEKEEKFEELVGYEHCCGPKRDDPELPDYSDDQE